MKAYVLIQTEDEEPLAARLETIPQIVLAQDLRGAYDAIALARTDSMRQLTDQVIEEIRKLPGVTHALPAPLLRSWTDGDVGDRQAARAA